MFYPITRTRITHTCRYQRTNVHKYTTTRMRMIIIHTLLTKPANKLFDAFMECSFVRLHQHSFYPDAFMGVFICAIGSTLVLS